MRQINELSNDELKNLIDMEKLQLCANKIQECLTYLHKKFKVVSKKQIKYVLGISFEENLSISSSADGCNDILFQTQDKYISTAIHVIMNTNDSYNLWRLLDKQPIVLRSTVCYGLRNYANFVVHFPKNINMYKKIYAYNLIAADKIIIEDIIEDTIINTVIQFSKKNDYYQGGYLSYLKESIHNKLYQICNEIDSKNKKLEKEINQGIKHKSYLTEEEVENLKYEFINVNFSDEFIKKYQIQELTNRQINYLRILSLVDVNKKISYKSISYLLETSERTIRRESQRIYKFFEEKTKNF